MPVVDVTPEEFVPILRRAGFTLTSGEAERLRQAYNELRRMLERLPREADFAAEPAVLFAPQGTRLVR